MAENREQAEAAVKADAAPKEEPRRPKTAKEREEEKQRKIAELEEEQRKKKEEDERRKELERRRYKRKLITPGVVLVIGAISSITMFFMRFENSRMLKWLLVILLAAWLVGSLVQYMFERFAKQNENNVSDEGEVINKSNPNPEEVEDEAHGRERT